MRVLPDKNFKENYKKHYAENYEKLKAKREERAELKRNREPDSLEVIKYRIAGAVATFVILGSFFAAGYLISSDYRKKENQIAELEAKISQADDQIRTYQIINGEETVEQVKDVLVYVTYLQNQYLSGNFSEDFDSLALRYLGDYNSNWSDSVESLSEPTWRGYINRASKFDTKAEFVFILYDTTKPVLIVFADYGIDQFGNLTTLSRIRKTVLS